MRKQLIVGMLGLLMAAGATIHAGRTSTVVVTSSNTTDNQLLVYDTTGALIESVPTLGQGGVSQNAGGIATNNGSVAVVNFGSQTVSVFGRSDGGFELREVVPALSQPVSVAFGKDHLYVLGTTTVESHRIGQGGIDVTADGTTALLAADGSSAQVGVTGDQLIVTEKSGTVEVVRLQGGAVDGIPAPVELPADVRDTPFGLVARGANAYVTIAHSDEIALIKNGDVIALEATGSGFPTGPGQQAPCWIALVGPYLFTANSPSHSISRLIAGGRTLVLDLPVAANTAGAPIDIAAAGSLLAVIEANGGSASHVSQFRIDGNGDLTPIASTAIPGAANGVAIVGGE